MSATHTCVWLLPFSLIVLLLLFISVTAQDKTPDVSVTCFVSAECILPCSFSPGADERVEWFRQDEVVYRFERRKGRGRGEEEDEDDDDEEDGGSKSSSEEEEEEKEEERHRDDRQLSGRASVFPHLVSRGNATLILRGAELRDRGSYRCHVVTAAGEHRAKVILKVEAPIKGLTLELSRLSGYEEMKCRVRDVFPAPRVTWSTEPPTFEDLRPVTRMLADAQGLYTVDSRLRPLTGQIDLIYICKVATAYGGQAWTTSLRHREIRGTEGRDLTIPCSAPSYLNHPALEWSFTSGDDLSHILSYDSQSGHSLSTPPWDQHVELDGFRVPFGDGSLRLMDPRPAEHTGSYTCRFSVPYNTHQDRTHVTIDTPTGERITAEQPSHWWIFGLVLGVLVLVLAAMLAFIKLRGSSGRKPRSQDPEEVTELHGVKGSAPDPIHVNEGSTLTDSATNGPTGGQT